VSWAAHELESYFLQKHVKLKVSYIAVLLGCLLPDLFTKLPVYGWQIGSFTLKAKVPYKYHRGWPGAGFTHSLSFGLLVGLIVLAIWKNRAWFVGILIGQAAHVFTDICDSVGTMVFWPATTQHYTIGMWAYASQAGRYGDAAAYYSSLGGVWDLLWLFLAIIGWRVFTRDFFFGRVVPDDPAWGWLRRKFALSDRAMVALYRAFFIYGGCRIFGWTLWARFHNPERGVQTVDYRWGGPSFVDKVVIPGEGWGTFLQNTLIGMAGSAIICFVMWKLIGRKLWARAS